MLKLFFDKISAFVLLVLLSPVFIVLMILIRSRLGSPVFFSQVRPGLNAKPFKMVKFRTMTNAKDASGNLLPNDQRMTKFGNFLRSSSLDEIPELWNVLMGEMSLVGPRPLLMDYVGLYSSEQAKRMNVRPGITGWAQVNGRNAISWEQKFALDIWYVNNQSFLLDIKILWQTLLKVVKREGIQNSKDVFMPRFTGTPKSES